MHQVCASKTREWGPIYMVSGTRDNPRQPSLPRQLYRAFICGKVVAANRLKVDLLNYSWSFLKFKSPDIFVRLSFFHSFDQCGLVLILFCFWSVNLSFKTVNFENTWLLARRELFRVGEPKCLYGKKLSRLPGSPYLRGRDNSPTRVVSPPETTRAGSYKRLMESFKDFTEKLARPG